MEEKDNLFEFTLPKHRSSIIKVIGIGGGGSNAINYMYENGIEGVDFVICNTDAQALEASRIPTKIQLGAELTEGLGAGSNPKVGRQAAEESVEKIKELLDANTKMLFITAGMGGGTGTGAAPIIAEVAKEKGILTVGVVTMPFSMEGGNRHQYATEGLNELKKHVDTLLVINNDKLFEVYGDLRFTEAFGKANEVLNIATKGIAEIISQHLLVNIDLNDAKRVLENSGTAVMGQSSAIGENRAIKAVEGALDSPLLNDNNIKGAKQVLLKIVSGGGEAEIRMMELAEIKRKIREAAGGDVNIIEGIGIDSNLNGEVCVTVIATGFDTKAVTAAPHRVIHLEEEKQSEFLSSEYQESSEESVHTIFEVEEDIVIPTTKKEEIPNETTTESTVSPLLEKEIKIDLIIEKDEPFLFEQDFEEDILVEDSMDIVDQHQQNEMAESTPEIFVIDLEDDFQPFISSEVKHEKVVLEEMEEKKELTINFPEFPINEELLAEKRKAMEERLRNISMKLRTPSGLTALEEEPAYKRNHVHLENTPHSSESEISRFTLSEGENSKLEIKPNNSFLHDNVD